MGWSQDEIANKLGVTRNYVGMLENGRDPGDTLVRLFDMIVSECDRGSFRLSDSESGGMAPREIIKRAMQEKDLDYKALAKLTKYNARVLQAVLEGDGQASEGMIDAISIALNLDKEQLMAGSEMPVTRDGIFGTYGATPDIIPPPGQSVRFVPLLSMAQAGTMSEQAFTDGGYQYEGVVAFDIKDRKAFAVRIVGDSMQPKFSEGDCVIVSPAKPPSNGAHVLARLSDSQGGDVMFKLFHSRDGGKRIILSSYNPAYPPLELSRENFLWIYSVVSMVRPL